MKRLPFLGGAAAAAVALVLGTGCSSNSSRDAAAPTCSAARVETLLIVAQSVPTAQRIPCINSYPAGWKLGDVEVRDGRSSFSLEPDDGDAKLTVVLEKDCVVTGAIEVATDERGTARFDRIPSGTDSLRTRNYRFAGGCVTYELRMGGPTAGLMDQATLAVGLMSRSEIEDRFYEPSSDDGGR
jgi:hypothetical protein